MALLANVLGGIVFTDGDFTASLQPKCRSNRMPVSQIDPPRRASRGRCCASRSLPYIGVNCRQRCLRLPLMLINPLLCLEYRLLERLPWRLRLTLERRLARL